MYRWLEPGSVEANYYKVNTISELAGSGMKIPFTLLQNQKRPISEGSKWFQSTDLEITFSYSKISLINLFLNVQFIIEMNPAEPIWPQIDLTQ